MKGLIGLKGLGRAELEAYLDLANRHRETIEARGATVPALAGVTVANLFFEPSTRTRLSFDLAAQRLGGRVITHHPESSSTLKGESLRDTALTVSAIGADVLVVRHSESGTPQSIAEWTGNIVLNAGDGTNEHPTQALTDLLTLRRRFGAVDGLQVGIVGHISHSRVANSLIYALSTMGARITLVGPRHWLPAASELTATTDFDEILAGLDVLYLLRVQTERGGTIDLDYVTRYQLGRERAARLGPESVVLHPGPLNRGVEIDDEVAESPRSLILEQVRNGVPTRMAVLERQVGASR